MSSLPGPNSQHKAYVGVKCPLVITFWHHSHKWYTFDDDLKRSLTPTEILYGVINRKKLDIALNHIVTIAKFHIYKSNINEIPPNFQAFLSLLKEKINIEKYIAFASHARESFSNKWGAALSAI